MAQGVPALITLTDKNFGSKGAWNRQIQKLLKKLEILPHGKRRLDNLDPDCITVLTAPSIPIWLAKIFVRSFETYHWLKPGFLLGFGKTPDQYKNPLVSFQSRRVFLLDLGLNSKNRRDTTNYWIQELLELSARKNKKIVFIPLIFLWNRSPKRKSYPAFYGFRVHNVHSLISTGEPLFVEPGVTMEPPEAMHIRRLQLRSWNQESRVIVGDRKLSMRKTISNIEKETLLNRQLEIISTQGKDTKATLLTRVSAYVREIAADYSHYAPLMWDIIIRPFLKRNFSALEFDHEGLDYLRVLLRKRERVILTPSHRSHLDYILISYSIYKQGIACPNVAAGQNLSFWPMGYIFRKTGAFFIRRTFKGLDIYPHVFRAYLWHLMRKFQPVEFFIEGGRSRTGALRPAKLGMLNMIIDAVNSGLLDDVKIVPLAVNYERIPEEESYVKELSGASKKKESIGSLFKSIHLLNEQFGKVSMATGQALSLKELIDNDLSPAELKDHIGSSIMNQIRTTMPVTPAALIVTSLMGLNSETGVFQTDIIKTSKNLLKIIKDLHPETPLSADFHTNDHSFFWIETLCRLIENGNIIPGTDSGYWKINPQRILQVDYLRNSILGLLLPCCFAALEKDDLPGTFTVEDLKSLLCPDIHPVPQTVLHHEISIAENLINAFDELTLQCLSGNIKQYQLLCDAIDKELKEQNIRMSTLLSRKWNMLFETIANERFTDHPEVRTGNIRGAFFKGFKRIRSVDE